MPAWFRRLLKLVLQSRGYRIERIAPMDVRSVPARDVLLDAAQRLPEVTVVDVPLDRCRNGLGASPAWNPFVAALTGGPPAAFPGSTLETYYHRCQPASALEVIGLRTEHAPGLAELPAHAFVMPWHDADPAEQAQRRARYARCEAAERGRHLDITDGVPPFGPVSPEKGAMEFQRLTRLYYSMSAQGYQRHDGSDGDVVGWLLTDGEGAWSVLVRAGLHRLAVAAALGLPSIPVRFRAAPVKREEVRYWPQVVAGRFTPEGALAVFDRVMEGTPAPACQFPLAADLASAETSSP